MSTEPSTEPLAGDSAGSSEASARCSSCGSAIASDQRYCLECGERLAPVSGFLLGRASGAGGESPPAAPPDAPPAPDAKAPRSNVLGVLGGVGLLLLAMGVGVLIGRAGNAKPAPAKEQVITEQAPAASPGTAATEASFTSDWPPSRSGYTVQLSTLPSSSTVAAVTAAKTAATAKGAPAVGALESSEFKSLPAGQYVIYSGDYHTSAQAQKALAAVHAKFPAAKVIHIAGSSSGGGSSGGGSGASTPHVHSSLSHPAPPSVLKSLKGKGKSYVEASKNLPDVVETG
ncbi:MAG TPA: zinc ribbon domain-containing protein [Solirubrobacteraceae bacterium]|nr:zinc ribbon domain-containing protein [Solirubrobacteraceae bacterium]